MHVPLSAEINLHYLIYMNSTKMCYKNTKICPTNYSSPLFVLHYIEGRNLSYNKLKNLSINCRY